jgi:magnesium chelatase family protein
VNLAPAERRKEGTGFDLAIALGILRASGQLHADVAALCLGELALDGVGSSPPALPLAFATILR